LRILFFGRLQQSQKQVRLFPDIYAALRKCAFPFRWTIHGEGPEKEFLAEHLQEGLERSEVCFSEPVRHDQLPRLVAAHDVYLLTSAHEGGPLSLIEGMGRGLVPVCGDIPCLVEEMITPANGFRVPREQAGAYAAAIQSLHCDRARLELMSVAARETALAHYSDVAMARRYLAFVDRYRSDAPGSWSDNIQVRPMVGAGWHLHPALRPLRRLRKSFRN
jgi:glycosyltransferase involved in cell wall biosynthesis